MQFGSETVIGPRVRMLLMDCFETLIELGAGGYVARRGLRRFLDEMASRGLIATVISDAPEPAVVGALRQAGLLERFSSIYDRRTAVEIGNGRLRKRLDVPLADAGIAPSEAVFIGDSPLDAEAAQLHQVPFIRIPRSEDRAFSFEQLISGPSKYASDEFAFTFDRHYLRP
jgi:phosphoglycolate phosphatase-like HAD superfamily hydrolase